MARLEEAGEGWLMLVEGDKREILLPREGAPPLRYPPPIGLQPLSDLNPTDCYGMLEKLDQHPQGVLNVMTVLTEARHAIRGSEVTREHFLGFGVYRVMLKIVREHSDNLRVLCLAAEVLAALLASDVPPHQTDLGVTRRALERGEGGGGLAAAELIQGVARNKEAECFARRDYLSELDWAQVLWLAQWLASQYECKDGFWVVRCRCMDAWGRQVHNGGGWVKLRRT